MKNTSAMGSQLISSIIWPLLLFKKTNDSDIEKIIRNATDILNREEGKNPFVLHEELQKIMNDHVGIVREKDELIEGMKKLEDLKEEIKIVKAHPASQYNPGWNVAIDLSNVIIASEAVAKSALIREESRGGHTRLDFPEETEAGLEYNVIIKKTEVAKNGDTVVAIINNEATLKRYYFSDEGIELHPQNPDFDIIHIQDGDDFKINGIVLAVFRKYSQR